MSAQPVDLDSTPAQSRRARRFEYVGFDIDADRNRISCRYRLDEREFEEVVGFPGGGDWAQPAAVEAARLIYLLAGVSYYKAGAPPLIDLGATALTDTERRFLREFYLEGLGEYAYRNGIDLSDLEISGPVLERRSPTGYEASGNRPLVPFGGGVDSIVSVELLRERLAAGHAARPSTAPPAPSSSSGPAAAPTASFDAALFVVNRPGDRFDAIEEPARVTGLPVIRAERTIDEQVLRSGELGFLNGHIPVTGIISALAVLAAVLDHRDAVVLSNEWSASSATLVVQGRAINHQYSKSETFEAGWRQVLAEAIGPGLDYFSLLRPFTEVWIARRFAELPQYFDHFRSCNRAFHIDRARRWDHWCGVCDKCAFIDLVLAPFVPQPLLGTVFRAAGTEPLANPDLRATFDRLLGRQPDAKPWECVGDVRESRVSARMAAERSDRQGFSMLAELAQWSAGFADPPPPALLAPIGRHFVPERYAPDLLLG